MPLCHKFYIFSLLVRKYLTYGLNFLVVQKIEKFKTENEFFGIIF